MTSIPSTIGGNHKRSYRVISNNEMTFLHSIIEGKDSKWKEFGIRSRRYSEFFNEEKRDNESHQSVLHSVTKMKIALCPGQLSSYYFQWAAILFHEEKKRFCTSSGNHKRGCRVISNNGMTSIPGIIE
ncbi:hypothetical protein CDAR_31901, partial [Caerostris darwini]